MKVFVGECGLEKNNGGGGPITILRVFRENGVKTFSFPGSTSVYPGVGRAWGFAGCLAWAFTLAPQNVGIGLAILTSGMIFRSARLRVARQGKQS